MPNPRLPLRLPLALLARHPLQIRITRAALPANPAVLELGEMALEEADLVLAVDAGRVNVLAHDAKVVKHLARGNCRFRLRDQLDAPHVLAVPEGGAVERELGALLGDGVVGVLVRGGQLDVFVYCAGAVDVVLVGADLSNTGDVSLLSISERDRDRNEPDSPNSIYSDPPQRKSR